MIWQSALDILEISQHSVALCHLLQKVWNETDFSRTCPGTNSRVLYTLCYFFLIHGVWIFYLEGCYLAWELRLFLCLKWCHTSTSGFNFEHITLTQNLVFWDQIHVSFVICMCLYSAQSRQRTDKKSICITGQMRSFYDLAFWCFTVAYCIYICVPDLRVSDIGVSQKLVWVWKELLISGSYLIPQRSQKGTWKGEKETSYK